MTSIIHRISCFVACPMKRKGKASRVRWKNRCRFPVGLICASGVKAVAAKSGGRMERSRSISRMRLECLRCIPLAASSVVSMSVPLPYAHGAGVFQQEYCRILFIRQPVIKGMQGGDHALGEVPFPLRSDADAGEGAVGGFLVDTAFQRGEDGNAHGDQPAAQATKGTGVVLLGLPDFSGEFQHSGFVKTRRSGQGGAIAGGWGGEHHRLFCGHPIAVLLDDVQHPAAECLGHWRPGEHGEEVAAAQAEDAGFLRAALRRESDHGGHRGGEFVGVAGVELGNLNVWGGVSQGSTDLVTPYPRLLILLNYVELYWKQRACDIVNLAIFLLAFLKWKRPGARNRCETAGIFPRRVFY